jgi:hypothetical protein
MGIMSNDIVRELEALTVEELFAGLRSPDLVVRIQAGAVLAYVLGAGVRLSGVDAESFEHLTAPQLSDLLGRAMSGELAAAEELGRIVTNVPAAARRAPTN